MLEAGDLLPAEVLSCLMEELRLWRLSGGTGVFEIHVDGGHVYTYGPYYSHRVGGRTRARTKPSNKPVKPN